ncbi:MAG: biotin--[acetyl-CoA-carboxylase] ligase [Acidimicrobiales bacterium]
MAPTHPTGVAGTRFRVAHVGEVSSTNTVVTEAAMRGEPEGLVVVADHQTAGRGRLGRSWVAPPGSGLLTSILLRPPPAALHLAVTAVGCAAAVACRRLTGVEPGLKWPNDLVVADGSGWRKLGGILAEASSAGGDVTAVVVGLGLNLRRPADLPADLAASAVAMDALTEDPPARDAVLEALLTELEPRYAGLISGGSPALLDEYRARCVTLGQWVRVEQSQGAFEGVAVEVDDAAALVVDRGARGRSRVEFGDVVHLRQA